MSEPDSWLDPDYIERLKNEIRDNPELQLITEIARRANLPASEVMARWSGWDLALEVASTSLRLESEIRSCPSCGIDPDVMLEGTGRNLAQDFAWRLDVHHCSFCAERDELAARLASEAYNPRPPVVRFVPRRVGEPFAPQGGEWSLGEVPEP